MEKQARQSMLTVVLIAVMCSAIISWMFVVRSCEGEAAQPAAALEGAR